MKDTEMNLKTMWAVACSLGVCASVAFAAPSQYAVRLFDADFQANSINDLGEVVGMRNDGQGHWKAQLIRSDGQIVDIPRLQPYLDCSATLINNNSEVAGQCWSRNDGANLEEAFVWNASSGVVSLRQPPEGGNRLWLRDLSTDGTIVGTAFLVDDNGQYVWSRAFEKRPSGRAHLLPLYGLYDNGASSINRHRTVVGEDSAFAVYWDKQRVVHLLRSLKGDYGQFVADDINDDRTVVGHAYVQGVASIAVVWYGLRASPQIIETPVLSSVETHINNQSTVIISGLPPGEHWLSGHRAYYWTSQDGLHDMDTLIAASDPYHGRIHVAWPASFNDVGQLLAYAVVDGVTRNIMLMPL